MKKALAVYVDKPGWLIHQAVALFESLLQTGCPDTYLVCFAPVDVLNRLPDNPRLIKCQQSPHRLGAQYPYINSIACFTQDGNEVLDQFDRILKTDVDTFITPAWRHFDPASFICGIGKYVHSDDVKNRIRLLANHFGAEHRNVHNLGSTFYGTPQQVRQVCAMATTITEYLIETEFAQAPGQWPGWFRGVSSMYATEVAINHLIPDCAGGSIELDYPSHEKQSVLRAPHLHCWYTKGDYSKHKWIDGLYKGREEKGLQLDLIPDYSLAMAIRAEKRMTTMTGG